MHKNIKLKKDNQIESQGLIKRNIKRLKFDLVNMNNKGNHLADCLYLLAAYIESKSRKKKKLNKSRSRKNDFDVFIDTNREGVPLE